MSEAAAAPAAPAPAAAPEASASGANVETKVALEAPSWSDKDDAELFEKLKRSPYKAKYKGEEKAISTRDEMREMLGYIQRGFGASKLAEEAKATKAEAEKHRAEVERTKKLLEAAKRGDFNARKELGFASPDEIRQRQAEWEQVPEPVRQMAQEVEELRAFRAKALEEKQAAEREAAERAEATEMLATRRQAVNFTHSVLQSLGLDKSEKAVERMLPQVAGAIADLSEAGLEIGVDMTEELVVQRVKERLGGWEDEVFSALEPKRLVGYLEQRLESAKTPEDIMAVVGEKMARRVAWALAKHMQARKAQPAAPVQQARDAPPETKPQPRQPLGLFRR